jgi:hypothetical protein
LVVAFVAAVGLHYLWDQTNDLTPHVVIAVISVAILVTLMVLTARRDKVRTLSHGPATGPAAIAPVPQPSWFSPVAILPVQPVETRPYVSEPERHAA